MAKQNQNVANYEIRLGCHIEKHQHYWFDEFSVTNLDNGNCVLSGPIPDQAALFGLLLKIRDLGLALISINHIPQK